MSRRFQFSLGRLFCATLLSALAILFEGEFFPIVFVVAGHEIGAIFRRPGYGLWAGFFVFCLLETMGKAVWR